LLDGGNFFVSMRGLDRGVAKHLIGLFEPIGHTENIKAERKNHSGKSKMSKRENVCPGSPVTTSVAKNTSHWIPGHWERETK